MTGESTNSGESPARALSISPRTACRVLAGVLFTAAAVCVTAGSPTSAAVLTGLGVFVLIPVVAGRAGPWHIREQRSPQLERAIVGVAWRACCVVALLSAAGVVGASDDGPLVAIVWAAAAGAWIAAFLVPIRTHRGKADSSRG